MAVDAARSGRAADGARSLLSRASGGFLRFRKARAVRHAAAGNARTAIGDVSNRGADSMIPPRTNWSAIFAGRMADACAQFFGGVTTRERPRRPDCLPISSIQLRPNARRPGGDPLALPGSVQPVGGRGAQGSSGRSMIIRARVVAPMAGEPIDDGAVVVAGEQDYRASAIFPKCSGAIGVRCLTSASKSCCRD